MSLPHRVLTERPTEGPLVDPFGRKHTYVRVSVTDRCNYRCVYCLPAEPITWLEREALLSFEEIARVVRVLAGMGVERIRLTGGEPTVRRGLEHLVGMLGGLGLRDIAMTTNGHLFARKAAAFAAAGLSRVNISIDTLDPEQFARITRGGDLSRVLASIDAALNAGLTPVKLNVVIVRGENEDAVDALIDRFGPYGDRVVVRFIEEMPFGTAVRRSVPSSELRARLGRRFTLVPCDRVAGVGPAVNWQIRETGQVIGFISPITEHFCQACNRLRLTADGHLRTCLSRDPVPSLRDVIRAGATDAELEEAIRTQVWGKVAGHEAHLDVPRNFEGVMTQIGG